MQLVSPVRNHSAQQNTRAPCLDSLDGLKIGLLSNTKVNADVLLEETAVLLARHHNCTPLPVVYKRNASAPAPLELIDELAASADLLLTASGD